MDLGDLSELVAGLDGVRERTADGLLEWSRHGRRVARQLDERSVVIRTSFDARDHLVRDFPGTFSVPSRLEKHMMVVADLSSGDRDAIEEAFTAAWRLQG
jgi:hypothetical protein